MRHRAIGAALFTGLCVTAAVAQEPATPALPQKPAQQAQPSTGAVPLRVTVLISRHQGDKKIGSLPYTFGVTSGERTNLRMGSEVPIVSKAPKSGETVSGVTYRSVGTNIDCSANPAPNGQFRVLLTIEDSSVHLDPAQKAGPGMVSDFPSFRTFKVNFVTLLRDGQSTQHTSATDPVSGELMKVDVTLNVIK